jgi:3-phenylpropionate/trans-cinnamate dioxygenase ferredoxin reductase subunit
MSASQNVAVVGGSLAGLRAAEQLRAAGHSGPITVYGNEPHLPYNRPPLSKEVLADPDRRTAEAMFDRLVFRRRSSVDDVVFHLGQAVVACDLAAGTLTLADGGTASFDGLVVASGLRPRRLRVDGPKRGAHVLRSIEDCVALRRSLSDESRVVVIGAGFIGCETAATLTSLGHHVVVIEPTGPPMNRVIGSALAGAIQQHHEAHGIHFVIGPGVRGYTGSERVDGVLLDDGATIGADVVVEAVGSVCNTEWLAGNTGLDLSDGVLTDNDLAVVGAERVVAVGDVARFPNPLFDGVPRRVEHWSMPTDTAKRAARTLACQLTGQAPEPAPFAPIPSFWSDQFDLRLQSFGSPALADEVTVEEGDLSDLTAGVLTKHTRGGELVGSIALNLAPARQRTLRDAFVSLVPTS